MSVCVLGMSFVNLSQSIAHLSAASCSIEQRGRTGRHSHGIARLSIVDLSIDFLPGCGFTINVDETLQIFELLSRPENLYCRRVCE